MKTLKNNVLIYDEECPMCRLYTKGFVKTGMIEVEGRKNYSSLPVQIAQLVDMDRARNEIALVNTQSQEVMYGLESLFFVVSHSFPIFKPLFMWKPFRWTLTWLYSFISYNRRIIVPGNDTENPGSCQPDFSFGHRIAYLILASLASAVVLQHFTPLLGPWWIIPTGIVPELFLVLGQLLFQFLALLWLHPIPDKRKYWNYLGHVVTVSLMGSLLLVPLLFLHRMAPQVPQLTYLAGFGVVVTVMFWEHFRRVRLFRLPKSLCISWVGYRLIVCTFYYLLTPNL